MGPANAGEPTSKELVKTRDISSWLAEVILHLSGLKGREVVKENPLVVKENYRTELVMDKISKMDWAAGGEE